MREIWKDIKGYEGLYQISNLGVVRSLDRITPDGKHIKGRLLKPHSNGRYIQYALCKDNKVKHLNAHRIVAEHFIPNPDNLPCINHKDENGFNNCVENLEWCTQKYNVNYGTGIQRRIESQTNHLSFSKIVLQYTLDGVFIAEYPSTMEIQRKLGFANQHISRCCRGKQKYAYGYLWRYKEGVSC